MKFRKRLGQGTYNAFRRAVRVLGLLVVLLVCAFVFLRVYGVPDPLLRGVIRRINASGFSVDLKTLSLTLRGWKATDVKYYSQNPDDLAPLFEAEEVLLARRVEVEDGSEQGWIFDIEAEGVRVNPSLEWGIELPEQSLFRKIEDAQVTIGFFADRIELSDGQLTWCDINFGVRGAFLKKSKTAASPRVPLVAPEKTGAESAESDTADLLKMEQWLADLAIAGSAVVDLDFLVDMNQIKNSRMDLHAEVVDAAYRHVPLDRIELLASYRHPAANIRLLQVESRGETLMGSGLYDIERGELEGRIENRISSPELLDFLPDTVLSFMEKIRLVPEYLPVFDLQFGPAQPSTLLNHLSGTFFIRNVSYCDLFVESARGRVERKDNRLTLSELTATAAGQESRAAEVGSGMVGGTATGEVFWDATAHTFGVVASGSLDPNLLVEPLSIVSIATNVISRFRFPEAPPQISLELGACYTNWHSFFIHIQGQGEDVQLHEGRFSSVNAAGSYSNGVLRVDPMVGLLGSDYVKGMLELNFFDSTAAFDVTSSIAPAVLQNAIYPPLNVFGEKIKTGGVTHIDAHGLLDWKTMQRTDFSATVEAERVEIPIVAFDDFSAVVTGKGPELTVQEAAYGLYNGRGEGAFRLLIDPQEKGLPYDVMLEIRDADFRSCLSYLYPSFDKAISGKLSASARIESDLKRNFFETANGTGQVSVVEGQLADLPFFSGFSRLARRLLPGFNVFSITSLSGDFSITDGLIASDNAYFEGDLISAKGRGTYSAGPGFDATIQVQVFSENSISKVIRKITSPLFKLFELHLGGSLAEPVWRLDNFTSSGKTRAEQDDEDSN